VDYCARTPTRIERRNTRSILHSAGVPQLVAARKSALWDARSMDTRRMSPPSSIGSFMPDIAARMQAGMVRWWRKVSEPALPYGALKPASRSMAACAVLDGRIPGSCPKSRGGATGARRTRWTSNSRKDPGRSGIADARSQGACKGSVDECGCTEVFSRSAAALGGSAPSAIAQGKKARPRCLAQPPSVLTVRRRIRFTNWNDFRECAATAAERTVQAPP